MSIESEIARLEKAKADIRDSILRCGIEVPTGAQTLSLYHECIDRIPSTVIEKVCRKYSVRNRVIPTLPLGIQPWDIQSEIVDAQSADLLIYGKNVFDGQMEPGRIDGNGHEISSSGYRRSAKMSPVNPGDKFFVSISSRLKYDIWVIGYDENMNPVTDGVFYPGEKANIGRIPKGQLIGSVMATSATCFVRFYHSADTSFTGKYCISQVPGYEDYKIIRHHVDFGETVAKAVVSWTDGVAQIKSPVQRDIEFTPIGGPSLGINTLYCENSMTNATWVEDPRQREPIEEAYDGYFATAVSSYGTGVLQTETI